MRIDFDALDPPYPETLTLAADVTDVNRQVWSASATMLVHPASVYVGLKVDRPFLRAGESMQIDALVVDLDGKAVRARPVTVSAARIDWKQTSQRLRGNGGRRADVLLRSPGDARGALLAPGEEGRGVPRDGDIRTTTPGARARRCTRVWVMDRDSDPPDRELPQELIKIVPDKKLYAAGDSAELLVVAPFAPAEGLLVLAREGILSTELFHPDVDDARP